MSNLVSLVDNNMILFEDEHLLVLNKLAGLVVNNSNTSLEGTVQDLVSTYLKKSPPTLAAPSDFAQRAGIVHRLDKDTSGVLLVAKDESTFVALQKRFKDRTIKKVYFAVVFGRILDEVIEITAPIGRDPRNRQKMAIVEGGRNAKTKVIRLNEFLHKGIWLSTVRVYPVTGRTHQIRVHLCALGNPVVGDRTYSGKNRYRWALNASEGGFTRMMLHACRLSYESNVFEAPFPPEFSQYVVNC